MTEPSNDGWRHDLENRKVINGLMACEMPAAFKAQSLPDEVRPDLGAHPIENQSSMGSCQGFTIASVCERLYQIATGEHRQLSNLFAYIASQKITGDQLYGRDSGSTISSGVQLATDNGICPLENAPYPQPVRYPNSRERQAILKQSNYAAGQPFRIRSSLGAVRSADQAVEMIGGGAAITLGAPWPPVIRDIDGRKTIVRGASSGGGHAYAVLGYKSNGNLIAANSHGYWMDITPGAFNDILNHHWTVAIGLSDLANPVPRDLSHLKTAMNAWANDIRELWT